MKPRTWKILSAALAGILLILACGNPYNGPAASTPLPTGTSLDNATGAVTTTPTPLLSTLSTATLSISSLATPNATQLAILLPGQGTGQMVKDAYGEHEYLQPAPPLDSFPTMNMPLTGPTYEKRPVYVDVSLPGCTSTMAVGTACSVWAVGNHAFITAYTNQWQPNPRTDQQMPLSAGIPLEFERMDGSYLFAKLTETDDQLTFRLSEISLTAPAANYTSQDGAEKIYWWTVQVYAPWGPLDRNQVQVGKIYTWFSYFLNTQYNMVMVCENAEALIAQGKMPEGVCYFKGMDDFLPAKVRLVFENTGIWLEFSDGTVGFAFNGYPWHFQDGFWARHGLPYPTE